MDTRKEAGQSAYPSRFLTVPNVLSVARLAGVPLFLWLVLGPQADLWALGILAASGVSDWLDGKIARAWNQASRLGQLLDPAADRLYIVAILAGLTLREIVPWWFAALLVGRELLLAVALAVLYGYGYEPLRVHFVGKAATLCLLYAFPLLFLGAYEGAAAGVANVAGWGFAIWGTGLYWCAAALYVAQVGQLVAAAHRGTTGRPDADATDTDAEGSGGSVTPEHEGRPA